MAPYQWVTGVIKTLIIGIITPFITSRGPSCMIRLMARISTCNIYSANWTAGQHSEQRKVHTMHTAKVTQLLSCSMNVMIWTPHSDSRELPIRMCTHFETPHIYIYYQSKQCVFIGFLRVPGCPRGGGIFSGEPWGFRMGRLGNLREHEGRLGESPHTRNRILLHFEGQHPSNLPYVSGIKFDPGKWW